MGVVMAAAAVDARTEAGAVRILALGNSLTAGYGLALADAFPARLESALRARGIDADVIDGGVSGDTTAGGLARLEWALADDPDIVIVELGANDGLRGLDPEVTRDNLASILDTLARRRIRVLLTGMMAPPNLGKDYGDRFNGIFGDLAGRFDVILYPFFLEGVAAQPGLNQSDGIHPNRAGVDRIVAGILPYLTPLIEAGPVEP